MCRPESKSCRRERGCGRNRLLVAKPPPWTLPSRSRTLSLSATTRLGSDAMGENYRVRWPRCYWTKVQDGDGAPEPKRLPQPHVGTADNERIGLTQQLATGRLAGPYPTGA